MKKMNAKTWSKMVKLKKWAGVKLSEFDLKETTTLTHKGQAIGQISNLNGDLRFALDKLPRNIDVFVLSKDIPIPCSFITFVGNGLIAIENSKNNDILFIKSGALTN